MFEQYYYKDKKEANLKIINNLSLDNLTEDNINISYNPPAYCWKFFENADSMPQYLCDYIGENYGDQAILSWDYYVLGNVEIVCSYLGVAFERSDGSCLSIIFRTKGW